MGERRWFNPVVSMDFVILVCLVLGLGGCNYRIEKQQVNEPLIGEGWFSFIQRVIIEPKCLQCHMGANAALGVNLSSYADILESIVPYQPAQSKFFTVIESGSMPKGGERLTDSEIQRVYDWISKGALQFAAPDPVPQPTPTPTPEPPPKPLFSWIAQNIFKKRCIECHRPPRPKGDVDLSSYSNLMDSEGITKIPVDPGNPEDSGTYDQVQRKKMPPGPDKLTEAEERCIYEWIKNGAEEN